MEGFELGKEQPMSDMELALYWIGHIEKPCEDGHGNNVRSVYLREAKTLLATRQFTNPYAKDMLEKAIRDYSR